MHLHGHDFSLLGQGNGTFDARGMMGLLKFENSTCRDVAMLGAQGWTVIAFETNNPGAWLMHCYIGWHLGDGLVLQFLEVPSQIPTLHTTTTSSEDYVDTCSTWNDYYNASPQYNKSDSGLKIRNARRDWALAQNHRTDVTRHLHHHKRRARVPHEY